MPSVEIKECPICFEKVDEVVKLPCACKHTFCLPCWDRCLARSQETIGAPRCPTCRQAMRVEFNSKSGRLVFFKVSDSWTQSHFWDRFNESADRDDEMAVVEFARQIKPTQVNNLQCWAKSQEYVRNIIENATLWTRSHQDAMDAVQACSNQTLERHQIISELIWRTSGGPTCICGGQLKRLDGIQRLKRCRKLACPRSASESAQLSARLLRNRLSGATCDFCDTEQAVNHAVWTCTSKNRTMFHQQAYDICEECFVKEIVEGFSRTHSFLDDFICDYQELFKYFEPCFRRTDSSARPPIEGQAN